MDLNQFSTVDIVLDKANDNIIQRQTISAGDRDGRSLTLQVTNEGSIGEVPGLTANLLWTNHSSGLSDLSAFSVVDRTTSIFKIEYPQNMLTAGKVTAQIQLLHNGKVTHSKKFEIIVLDVAGSLKGVLQTAEYTALVEALAKTNGFETEIAEVSTQLAHKANELDTKKIDKGNASVNDINKNLGKFDETFFSDSFNERLNAGELTVTNVTSKSITSDKLANSSVTPDIASFTKRGKNKWDGILLTDTALSGSNPFTLSSSPSAITVIGKVEPNKKYTVSKGAGTNRLRVGASSVYPEIGTTIRALATADTINSTTVTTNENEHYLVVYLSSDGTIPTNVQIEEGVSVTDYEDPNKHPQIDMTEGNIKNRHIADDEIGLEKLTTKPAILTGHPQIFNVKLVEEKITTVGAGGFVNLGNKVINLKDGEWSYAHITANSVVVAFDPSNSDILFFGIRDIVNDVNRKYSMLGLIRKDKGTCLFNGMYSLDNSAVLAFTEEDRKRINEIPPVFGGVKKYHIEDSIRGLYKSTIPNFLNPYLSELHQEVYDIYDGIVNAYPYYCSRKLEGNDGAENPIYSYTFTPKQIPVDNISINTPKVVVTNTHSFEKPAVLGTAKFFEDLANNWQNNELLRALRWNVEFVVYPMANPYGYDNEQRVTYQGADIARNFPAGWNQEGENANPDSMYYAGEAPMTNVENQIFDAFMDKHLDAVWAIDVHNYTDLVTSNTILWSASSKNHIQKFLGGFTQMMSSVAQQEYTLENYEGEALGLVRATVAGGSTTRQWESKGINASLLELVVWFNTTHQDVQGFSATSIGNLILSGLRNLI